MVLSGRRRTRAPPHDDARAAPPGRGRRTQRGEPPPWRGRAVLRGACGPWGGWRRAGGSPAPRGSPGSPGAEPPPPPKGAKVGLGRPPETLAPTGSSDRPLACLSRERGMLKIGRIESAWGPDFGHCAPACAPAPFSARGSTCYSPARRRGTETNPEPRCGSRRPGSEVVDVELGTLYGATPAQVYRWLKAAADDGYAVVACWRCRRHSLPSFLDGAHLPERGEKKFNLSCVRRGAPSRDRRSARSGFSPEAESHYQADVANPELDEWLAELRKCEWVCRRCHHEMDEERRAGRPLYREGAA